MIHRSYRLELRLNKTQEALCTKSAGTSRFAYNWKLAALISEYEANKSLAAMYDLPKVPSTHGNAIDWHREWVKLKEQLPWICSSCDAEHDRDVNAAKNLKFLGLWLLDKHLLETATTESSSGCNACGDERLQFLTEQCSSMKQEFKAMCKHSLIER